MKRSDQINELASALAKVQSILQPAEKDGTNPAFKSRYASIAAIWDVARKPLTACGLCLVQTPEFDANGAPMLETTLIHTSGQWIASVQPLTGDLSTPQKYGSALTYARRYGMTTMIGIVADDDDGDAASSGNGQQARRVVQTAPVTQPTAGRPLTPEALRTALRAKCAKPPADLDAEKVTKAGMMTLRDMFGAEPNQHAALEYLFGRDSRKDVTPAEWWALNQWRDAKKQGEEWVPNEFAVREARLLLAALNAAQAEQPLFEEEAA